VQRPDAIPDVIADPSAGLRWQARAKLQAHRAGSHLAASQLRDLLLEEVRWLQSQAASNGTTVSIADMSDPVSYFLARREADALIGRARDAARLPSPWDSIARSSVPAARQFLHAVGIAAAAAAIESPDGGPPPLGFAVLLRRFGEARIDLILTRRLTASLTSLLTESERGMVRDLIQRLARDRSGESLAVAVGRRIAAIDWHGLPLSDRETLRKIAEPALIEMFASLEPLPLQGLAVRSLLGMGFD
jgi:hypothetical protein